MRGAYGITQYMEGTGANLRLPLNPPFFFESDVPYNITSGAGTLTTGFADVLPRTEPSGQVRAWDPNLRPQFTQQWNVFVERLITNTMSANIGYVGHKATHLVAPVEGNQPLPGVGDPTDLGAIAGAAPAVQDGAADPEHLDHGVARAQRLQRPPGEPSAAQRQWRRVPGVVHAEPDAHEQPRVTTDRAASTPRAPTGPTRTIRKRTTVRRSTTLGTISCCLQPTSCRSGKAAAGRAMSPAR